MKGKVRRYAPALVLLAALGAAVGCAHKQNDAEITSTIQSSFNADSGLQGKKLDIQSANGTVTLSGMVDNDAERTAAARYAAAAPGVKTVVNNLEIAGQQASAEPAPVPAQAQTQPQTQPPHEEERNVAATRHTTKPSPARRRKNEMARAAVNDSPAPADNPAPTPVVQMQPPAQTAEPAMAAPPPPPPQKVTIPSGTTLAIRLVDAIDSETAQQGQTFRATLDSPLAVDGEVAIPAGYDVEGHVVEVQSAGKFAGKSLLTLQLDRVSAAGKLYNIQTDTWHREGSSRGKNTAEKVGAGSVIGAIIGGIAGGGKGAAVGAAAGAGVGGGVQAATKGQQIKLPSETVLNFTLESPLTVTPTAESPNSGRRRLDSN